MTEQDWIAANAPGGWIDDLRRERDTLKAALVEVRDGLDWYWDSPNEEQAEIKAVVAAALAACVPPQEPEK